MLVLAAFGPGRTAEIFAQQAEQQGEAATPEYNAAVKLQNKGEYKLAAEQWADFISKHPTDPRTVAPTIIWASAICSPTIWTRPSSASRRSSRTIPSSTCSRPSYLHLGVTQFKLAQAGKAELYDAAAATFQTLMRSIPHGQYLAQALLNRGDCLYHRNRKKEAAQLYDHLSRNFRQTSSWPTRYMPWASPARNSASRRKPARPMTLS